MTRTTSPRQASNAPNSAGPRSSEQIGKLFDKLPPHALEAECALLGSMMLDCQAIGEVVQIIRSREDFYKTSHAAIYQVLVDLYDHNQTIDMVHLNQRLRDLNLLEQIGGLEYVIELAESVPSAANAAHYARLVRDKALLRGLIDAAGKILYDAYHAGEPVNNLLDAAEQAIFKLAETGVGMEAAELRQLLQELYHRLETQEGQDITGLASGFVDLDRMTSGLQNGEMIIVAARPSMGKTALALNIAEHVAVNLQQPTAIFSLEMSKQSLAQRILCSRSAVDSQKVRRNMLSGDDFAMLAQAVGELSDAPLYIDDTPGLTLLGLRARARRLAARHDIKLLIVDYLQLMTHPGANNRQEEVSEMSRGIKALARELSVPVICLSQLNRGPEAREGHRPRMSDLRESGSIEQDADVVLMLHREEYYHTDEDWRDTNPEKIGTAEIILAKQRNGPTGAVNLQFNHHLTRFNNLTSSMAAPY